MASTASAVVCRIAFLCTLPISLSVPLIFTRDELLTGLFFSFLFDNNQTKRSCRLQVLARYPDQGIPPFPALQPRSRHLRVQEDWHQSAHGRRQWRQDLPTAPVVCCFLGRRKVHDRSSDLVHISRRFILDSSFATFSGIPSNQRRSGRYCQARCRRLLFPPVQGRRRLGSAYCACERI